MMGDPTGPFMYGLVGTSIQAFMTDPLTGYFNPVAGTLISAPGVNGNFLFSVPPGQQNLVGPVAGLTPGVLSLGNITVGTPSPAQPITLTSTGDQALSLNSITISGANTSEFSESDTCLPPTVLQPSKSCMISVIFTPSATGLRQATLMVADNAPGSPQIVQLSGTGVAPPPPKPAVTLVPGSVSFTTITQGTASSPTTVTVTNSGNATLHITSVVVAGNNPNDFATTNKCSGAVSANASCTIVVTCAPLAAGQRSETITLADDAPDSPQVIDVAGNANPAVSVGTAPGGSTTASVSAGQTAQFQMQLTPGVGFSSTVSLACNGAPLYATCQVPANVSISNGAAAAFTVSVSTKGAARIPPSIPRRFLPPSGIRVLLLLVVAFLLAKAFKNGWMFARPLSARRLAISSALGTILLCSVIYAAGCGSSSVTTTPPPVITPSGTSTLTITMGAMSPTQQPLQLQPIQLTLTVK
jgi:hypothetical protein